MRLFSFKFLLLLALFVALVVKGGQLCTDDGPLAMAKLADRSFTEPPVNAPLRPIEEEFRGVSPLPSMKEDVAPARKDAKNRPVVSRKPSKQQTLKDAQKKNARKG